MTGCSVLGGGQGRYEEDEERSTRKLNRGTTEDVFRERDQRAKRHGEECHCLPSPILSLFFAFLLSPTIGMTGGWVNFE